MFDFDSLAIHFPFSQARSLQGVLISFPEADQAMVLRFTCRGGTNHSTASVGDQRLGGWVQAGYWNDLALYVIGFDSNVG